MTDVVISQDKQSFAISGNQKFRAATDPPTPRGLMGKVSKFTLDGALVWTTNTSSTPYDGSAGPSSYMILNECWGLQAFSDGYVIGCGTGIENCPASLPAGNAADCAAGTADSVCLRPHPIFIPIFLCALLALWRPIAR